MKRKYKRFLKAAYINYEEDYCGSGSGVFTKPTVTTPIIVITGTSAIIACAVSGATIYYTLDGSTPTSSSTLYTGAITLTQSCTIKAIAVKSGMTNSSVAEESYVKPITYLTQWKMLGNSQVHTDPYLTSWKVSGNSVVDNNTILSCGDLGQDGKYHVKISNGVDIYDIALTEPLRKVNDVADTIEFPSETEGKALVTRNVDSKIVTPFCDKAGNQIVTTLVDGVNIAWQQLVKNGCFSDLTAWTDKGITGDVSVSDNILTITTTATGDKWVEQIISVNPASEDKLIVKAENFHDLRQNRIFRVVQDSNVKVGIVYTDSNTWNTCASIFTSASSSPLYVRLQGTDINTGVMKFKDVTMYNLTSMLPSSIVSQITSYQNFETMFHSENSQELGYVDYSSQPVNVITYGGKLYKDSVSGIEILVPLATPTTELVDATQIAASPTDTYTSANAVPYSAFEHTENKEIWSCGEYNPIDGKYHILVQPLGGSIADIALTEPLRKVDDVADTIEFPSGTEGKALITRRITSSNLGTLNFTKNTTSVTDTYRFSSSALKNVISPVINSAYLGNIICAIYDTTTANNTWNASKIGIAVNNNGVLTIYDDNYNQSTDFNAFLEHINGVEIIYELATPTTELVDAPQIAEADSYTCVISQGAKAVEWSSFETE